MKPPSTYANHERVRVLTAKRNHVCWAWSEKCSAPREGVDGARCSRMIAAGEEYVESTIYAGHDSGYVERGQKPLRSRHCMSCAKRWRNLSEALDRLDVGCTALSAAWCPIHGDCVCERENGLDSPDCPLHALESAHAEAEVVQ